MVEPRPRDEIDKLYKTNRWRKLRPVIIARDYGLCQECKRRDLVRRGVVGQTLSLNRVYPKLNGVNCGIDTNLELITLAPGINEIEIQNVANVKSSWDFRFLYK